MRATAGGPILLIAIGNTHANLRQTSMSTALKICDADKRRSPTLPEKSKGQHRRKNVF